MYVCAKGKTEQKVYNIISEKTITANGDSLFGKTRIEVPKQLNDRESEAAEVVVRKYIHRYQDEFLPFDCYFQQYLGYKKEGALMVDVVLFLYYRAIYQKGVAGITREDYRIRFRLLKDFGKERKRLMTDLDKGAIVNERDDFRHVILVFGSSETWSVQLDILYNKYTESRRGRR